MQKFNRIKISKDATGKLRTLKARTGVTPNLLCRIALCYSLNNEKLSTLVPSDEEGQEFNRFTLTGEFDSFFVALVKERCVQDGLDPEKEFVSQFKLHLNHGILVISGRIKDLPDMVNLLGVGNV